MESLRSGSYATMFSVLPDRQPEDHLAITRKHLHGELLDRLREMIIHGEIGPGSKIPEKELCNQFGISRTPLREALKVIAFEGLISLNHNRGAVVRPLSVIDLRELFPIYTHLQVLAAVLACERLSTEDIEKLMKLHERHSAVVKANAFPDCVAIDDAVHVGIERACGSSMLISLLQVVSGRIRQARYSIRAPEARLKDALAEHERILVKLKERDPEGLSRAVRAHAENSLRFFDSALSRSVLTSS